MKRNNGYQDWLTYGVVATQAGSSVLAGAAIGYFLDRWLHTSPWFLILWILLGVAAGFRSLFRAMKDMERREEERKASRK
ncbi:MAG: AtpZ/AtpI family protein [bacterium]